MASLFPPVPAPATFYTRVGTQPTTIVWGTDGLLGSYIVISASETVRGELIEIEQGTGFEATAIMLNKGIDITFECVDDQSLTRPTVGMVGVFSTPVYNSGGANATGGANIKFFITGVGTSQGRKQEGHITISGKSYNAITLPAGNYNP